MQAGVKKAVSSDRATVAVGIPETEFPCRLAEQVEHIVNPASIVIADTIGQLREIVARQKPRIIILDDRILDRASLREALLEFATAAHVILVAVHDRHPEVARLIAEGRIDFVPRADEWESLASSLVERKLRWEQDGSNWVPVRPSFRQDLSAIFRHEINNPLTGILGNAELLLAHSEGFPPLERQRIRTIVELAVRLRETVRRANDLWESDGTPNPTRPV